MMRYVIPGTSDFAESMREVWHDFERLESVSVSNRYPPPIAKHGRRAALSRELRECRNASRTNSTQPEERSPQNVGPMEAGLWR
jgi:hypothetical protein